MSGEDPITLAALKREFDEGFAVSRAGGADPEVDLLVVRVGDRKLALRAAELGGVVPCPPLTLLPGAQPALLGVARVRSSLVAVYSLGALLGMGPPRAGSWGVLAGAHRALCLTFDELEHYVRATPAALRLEKGDPGRAWASIAGEPLEVVGLPRIVAGLERTKELRGTREKT